MRSLQLALLLGLVACLGCGAASNQGKKYGVPVNAPQDGPLRKQLPERADQAAPDQAVAAQAPAGGVADPKPEPAEPVKRRIKYTADLRVIVEDFAKAEEELTGLVKAHQGYVAQAEITGSAGAPRSGRWKLRVPLDRFDDFLHAVVKLGVPERNFTDSEDVTAEYYDVAARIRNKKREEEGLLKLLERTNDKLTDLLAVRRELSQVRGEIEQLEGRLRVLANLTDLATVTVTLQEIKNYVPPQAPTFGASVTGTFGDSLDLLVRFGKGLVLVAVALAPWLPVLALVVVPLWLLLRWRGQPRRLAAVRTAEPGVQ